MRRPSLAVAAATGPDFALSPKQLLSIREATGVVNVWEGAISSGKTIGSLFRWLIAVAKAPSTGAVVMVGRTRDSLARNVLEPLMDANLFGDMAAQTKYTPGAGTARILGRTVYVLGANDAKAEPKIRGLTVALAYVDEVTTLPELFFRQLRGRMRVPRAQMFVTTNPDATTHWFKKKYLDAAPKGWRRFHFVMDDNPSLTESYKAQMRRENVGLWYRRFILGEWVNAEGAVYEMWDEKRHVIPWADLPGMHRLLAVGVDYGTSNASAALMLGLGLDRRLYLVDEWRYDPQTTQRKMTDSEQATSMLAWLRQPHLPYDTYLKPEWIAVDPAAASLKVQLVADGLGSVIDADNDVLYGIRTTASLLGAGKLLVSDRCTGFITEVPAYSWDDKATIEGRDKPRKIDDHSLDGGRYAVATTESLWRLDVELAAA